MSINILIHMPDPMTSQEAPKPLSIEEKVRDALECIESGYRSDQEWLMIRKLYRQLSEMRKPSQRAKDLLDMIRPVMNKYGYHSGSEL